MTGNIENAKTVLLENARVLYGIFGVVASSNYFPPRDLLNEFLMGGSDPCDQDERMAPWQPFALSPEEFAAVQQWWCELHPDAVTDALGATYWSEWTRELLDLRGL